MVCFGGDENVLKLGVVIAQLSEYTKNHRPVHFRWENCEVYELPLNRELILFKKRICLLFQTL